MTPRQMGRKGGKATGASKVRGDSAYYRALAAKRATKDMACGFSFPDGSFCAMQAPHEHSGDEPGE